MRSYGFWVICVLAASANGQEIVIRTGLGKPIPPARRSIVHIDPVEREIVLGTWKPPQANADGWTAVEAGRDGVFGGRPLNGGYVYASVDSPKERIVLLEASGHSLAYVNGVPRTGDPYSYGYVSLPIKLVQGRNDFLFLCGRGRLAARLIDPTKPVSLDLRDSTTPDLVKGEKGQAWAAVVVRNATESTVKSLRVEAVSDGQTVTTRLPEVLDLATRKVGFQIPLTASGKVKLRLHNGSSLLDEAELSLRVREKGQPYKRTFVSEIDGSVQYFAINPSTRQGADQALFLSLHGASVEAIGQAEAYSPKTWGHLVAPTNRRPYGFDWEEVGRLDALEVLDHARSLLKTDPTKTYLTGHSMGGHGTWQIGAHFPNLFAAIAPSAGWISFTTYAGGATYQNPTEVEKMLLRAATPSDTLGLKFNYANQGVYILHGDADDNVPVDQARTMRKELESFHRDFNWHEEKGAGHWWDAAEEAGADAVDFAPIFDAFARHRLPNPSEVRFVDFTTASSGISAQLRWATIEQQDEAFVLSRIQLRADPISRRFAGTTTNVSRLTLDVAPLVPGSTLSLELDGQKLANVAWPKDGQIRLAKTSGRWAVTGPVLPTEKNPRRFGGFKDIFRHRFILVYGTKGSAAENAWAKAKAKYDAETFWYRGNGSVDIVADVDFRPQNHRQRNVVLYGAATSNAIWPVLLADSPIRLSSGSLAFDGQTEAAAGTACLFIRPRPDSDVASVAVVGGVDLIGCRLTDRVPFFTSGAAIPDFVALTAAMLEKGSSGILAAGYFGMDWNLKTGNIARNKS